MPDSAPYVQEEGEGTGAPESPALFLMVLAWFLTGLARYENEHIPAHILLGERKILPVQSIGYMDDLHFLQKDPVVANIRL